MKKKLFITMILIVIVTMLCAEGVSMIQLHRMEITLNKGNEETWDAVLEESYRSMLEEDEIYLSQLAKSWARVADERFNDIKRSSENLAYAAAEILANQEHYSESSLKVLSEEDMGSFVVVSSFSNDEDFENEDMIRERNLLSNLQGMMSSYKVSFPNLGAAYIGLEDGLYIGSEDMREDYIGDKATHIIFDPRTRPWYQMTKERGASGFSDVFRDADTGSYSISCGAPIYVNGKLAGVAGMGLFIDELEKAITRFNIGKDGFSCVIDDKGELLFTGKQIGELNLAEAGHINLAESKNPSMSEAVNCILNEQDGIYSVTLDGEEYSLSSAPMETMGWHYMALLPLDEVMETSDKLVASLLEFSTMQNESVREIMRSTMIWLGLAFFLALIIAMLLSQFLSKRLVWPIVLLTSKVQDMKGDHLDFDLKLNTKDEIQTLAESFGSLTERMKQYIKDITSITAEKERIGAELSVATQIQSDMLPSIFPAFPDREEFDLFAAMDPAKEVGGDFYDFFMLDHDHLACVIADVSGKGVPAALFMVVAKTLIKNQAQNEASPAKILEIVNNELCANNKASMFVTAWIGIMEISTGKMICCNAGHEYPAIRGEDGEFKLLKDDHGLVLAALEDVTFTDYEITIPDNGTIFVYTDGVPEATSMQDELYNLDRMIDALNQEPDAPPERLLEIVRKDIDAFVGEADQFDDLTMLCLKRRKKE